MSLLSLMLPDPPALPGGGGIGRTGPGYKALPLVSRRPRAPAPGCSEVEGERERERERARGGMEEPQAVSE